MPSQGFDSLMMARARPLTQGPCTLSLTVVPRKAKSITPVGGSGRRRHTQLRAGLRRLAAAPGRDVHCPGDWRLSDAQPKLPTGPQLCADPPMNSTSSEMLKVLLVTGW